MGFRQVPIGRFPHGGVFVAEIDREPQELAERFGVAFAESWDNLDTYDFVAFELADGSHVRLIRHRNAPYPGMMTIADARATPSKVIRQMEEVLDLDDARDVAPRRRIARRSGRHLLIPLLSGIDDSPLIPPRVSFEIPAPRRRNLRH